METKFQTSFIPRKPLPSIGGVGANAGVGLAPHRPRHSNSVFFNLALLLFIISLGAGGGMLALKSMTLSSQEGLKTQLSERRKQFNPDLIEELKRINVKIDNSKQVVENHLILSNIFDVIGRLTIEKVRFTNMDLSVDREHSNDIKVSLNGYGTSLAAVAFQSDVLNQLQEYGLRKIVKNPMISNPTLDTTGNVNFGFSASIDPTSLRYTDASISSTTGDQYNNE
ncbi:MAG: hypothetical protein WCW03_02455 [Candidatus Paceibacterota bacterium]|jgi:hypothetical protein